jgi:hypothetical protein
VKGLNSHLNGERYAEIGLLTAPERWQDTNTLFRLFAKSLVSKRPSKSKLVSYVIKKRIRELNSSSSQLSRLGVRQMFGILEQNNKCHRPSVFLLPFRHIQRQQTSAVLHSREATRSRDISKLLARKQESRCQSHAGTRF